MHITDFESHIDGKILARGQRYFDDGMVVDVWAEAPSRYQAVVDGSVSYDVEIHLNPKSEVVFHNCDCPYDWGEYCKHEVAVLLAIRKHLKHGTTLKAHGKKRGMQALLQGKSKKVLVNLLCELAAEYDLREDIFYHLENSIEDD